MLSASLYDVQGSSYLRVIASDVYFMNIREGEGFDRWAALCPQKWEQFCIGRLDEESIILLKGYV